MSAREFGEWRALYGMEPFGGRRGDLQAAVVASTMANVMRGDHEAYELDDFLLDFEREEKSAEEVWEMLMGWAEMAAPSQPPPE